jgi:hypothetical protein
VVETVLDAFGGVEAGPPDESTRETTPTMVTTVTTVTEIVNDSKSLWRACRGGHRDVAEMLIVKGGGDVNVLGTGNSTPLWIACSHGNDATVRMLLQHQADPHLMDDHQLSPMKICQVLKLSSTVDLLLGFGIALEEVDEDGDGGGGGEAGEEGEVEGHDQQHKQSVPLYRTISEQQHEQKEKEPMERTSQKMVLNTPTIVEVEEEEEEGVGEEEEEEEEEEEGSGTSSTVPVITRMGSKPNNGGVQQSRKEHNNSGNNDNNGGNNRKRFSHQSTGGSTRSSIRKSHLMRLSSEITEEEVKKLQQSRKERNNNNRTDGAVVPRLGSTLKSSSVGNTASRPVSLSALKRNSDNSGGNNRKRFGHQSTGGSSTGTRSSSIRSKSHLMRLSSEITEEEAKKMQQSK